MVLEADPDRKLYIKRWANGEVESTRAVRQSQATLDEEAFEGKLEESAKDLKEEEPPDAEEDEEKDGEEEDKENEGDSDSSGDDDDDIEGSGTSRDKDSSGGDNAVFEEAEEAKEEEESGGRNIREYGSGGDTKKGSGSKVDSLLQIRRAERGRSSRELVLRGILVPRSAREQ